MGNSRDYERTGKKKKGKKIVGHNPMTAAATASLGLRDDLVLLPTVMLRSIL